ncbi:Probable E3 ubiquitin-protein ligase sinah, partial [Gryllus bimaculatus]
MTAELSSQEVLQPTTSVQGAAARAAEVKSEATEAEARACAVVEAGSVARAVACPGPTLPPRARSRSLSPHAPVPGRRQSYAKFGRLLLEAFQPSASQQSAGARARTGGRARGRRGPGAGPSGDEGEARAGPASRALSRSPSPAAAAASAAAPQAAQDEMLRLLECPVCMEHMFPPIEQCVNGHSVCARCRLCVSECPECKGRFAGTRCRRLEAICEVLLPRPCRHSTLGCRERLFADALPQHEAACGFRPS